MMEQQGKAYYWTGFSLVGDWGEGKAVAPTPTVIPTPVTTATPTSAPARAVVESAPTRAPEREGGGLCGSAAALAGLVWVVNKR